MRFFCAIVIASAYRLWLEGTGLWLALWTKQQVSDELKRDRLKVCSQQCPIYYSPLRTCGSPLVKKHSKMLGCHCYMPKKAGQITQCWAFENGFDWGWPVELNSQPHEHRPSQGQ